MRSDCQPCERSTTPVGTIAITATIVCLFAHADVPLSISGYVRTDAVTARQSWPDELPYEKDVWSISTQLRLECDVRFQTATSLHGAYSIGPVFADTALDAIPSLIASPNAGSYRVADFEAQAYPEAPDTLGSCSLHHNLDRLYALWSFDRADLLIGRQAIAWGSARVVNPTDVIAPYAFTTINQEERYGVDAVRLRVPFGALSELDLGYVPGDEFDFRNSAMFVRHRFNVSNTDVGLLAMGFRRHLLLGLDVARSLGDAGVWVEAAYVKPGFLEHDDDDDDKGYLRSSVGADTRLAADTYGFVELHFNSAGASHEEEYADVVSTPAYIDGAVYLLGQRYAALGVSHQFSPLWTLTGTLLCNVDDHSAHCSTQLEYNVATDLYVTLGVSLGLGANPGVVTDADSTEAISYESEFGAYSDFVFAVLRRYF